MPKSKKADQSSPTEKQLVPRREVERLTSLSCTTIYRAMEENDFPRPIRVSTMRVAWIRSEILEWVESRIRDQRVHYDGRVTTPPQKTS